MRNISHFPKGLAVDLAAATATEAAIAATTGGAAGAGAGLTAATGTTEKIGMIIRLRRRE